MIEAKVICDSIANGIRLTTLELLYPRFIHSEFMTHRMFSRNASSSRAIPISKVLEQVRNNPAMPIHWGKNQPGMQARDECNNYIEYTYLRKTREKFWKYIADVASYQAEAMSKAGYHKQIVNRLLEPFQWMKVIVTATEWDNFFVLRLPFDELNDKQKQIALEWKIRFNDHPNGIDAQPEIQELARCMKKAMEESTPVELKPGEWHLPYINEDEICMAQVGYSEPYCINLDDLIKCSVARCDRLLAAGHMSPLEHQATPMRMNVDLNCNPLHWEKGITHMDRRQRLWSANFFGWIQYRQLIEQGAA